MKNLSLRKINNFTKSNIYRCDIHKLIPGGAHTYSKGDDQYNADLSQKRAQSVLDYLSDRGVDRSRMAAKGMGKQNPIAPNSINGKDNPKGRQANRRTEFKITADIPTKRLIFDSSNPGNIEQQSLNVENNEADVPEGGDAEYRKGGRVGQGN